MAATLYKWRDAGGRLQISDDPPGEIMRKLAQLRERTRFDDDEYDHFKDEILELEERARLVRSSARQADLMTRQAELLKRTVESLAAGKCPNDY
jgi:hypothetical protein